MWSHWSGIMIGTKGKRAPQNVVLEGVDRPLDDQTLLLDHAVLDLPYLELLADVQHRALFALHYLRQNVPSLSV